MFVKFIKNNIIIMKIKFNIKFGYKYVLIVNIGISINKISNDIKKLICESILVLWLFLVFIINKLYFVFIIGIKIIVIFEKIVNLLNFVGEYSFVIIGVVMINMIWVMLLFKIIKNELLINLFNFIINFRFFWWFLLDCYL